MGDWGNDSRDDDPEVEISAKIGRDESEDDLKVDATALAENGCDDSADEVMPPERMVVTKMILSESSFRQRRRAC